MTKDNKKFDNESETDYNPEARIAKSESPDISDEMFREDIVLSAEGGSAFGGEESIVLDATKKLREKLKICVSEKQEYLEGWQRTKADFINFKKDEEERRGDLIKFAKGDFIENVLPILDSFNMASNSDSSSGGMEQIKRQLEGVLKKEVWKKSVQWGKISIQTYMRRLG